MWAQARNLYAGAFVTVQAPHECRWGRVGDDAAVRRLQLLPPMSWFLALCGAVAAERLAELRWSRAHERRMARRGGELVREPLYAAMVALHAGVLVAAPLEAWLRPRGGRWVRAA